MFHSIKGTFRALAISSASIVLPVPGSPLINNGFSKFTDALTDKLRSSVEIYVFVPLNCIVCLRD